MTRTTRKITHELVTPLMLDARSKSSIERGFGKQKWVLFCEQMLHRGYKMTMYEARQTVSKYITITGPCGKTFKVRFSNHKPNKGKELQGDCDFFVGRTHTGVRNTDQAVEAVNRFFSQVTA